MWNVLYAKRWSLLNLIVLRCSNSYKFAYTQWLGSSFLVIDSVSILAQLKRLRSAFKNPADFLSDSERINFARIFERFTSVLDLGFSGAVEAAHDHLFRIRCFHQVRIVSNDDYLAYVLAFSEILNQIWVNGQVIQIVIRLIDDQGSVVVLFCF